MPFSSSKGALILLLIGTFGLLVTTGCRSESSSTPDDAVSSGPTFEEQYRPQFHYSPPQNWMNDPNGLVYHDGTYHLFHQYNPEGNTWGHMSWYHATSDDLVHWNHQGVAIPEEGNEMIFSGSAVVDSANTSGFGNGEDSSPMVAIYTSHYTLGEDSIDQAQSLAYSTDGGKTWTKYGGNPVLEHPDPNFRDPNVFWYEPGEKWVMTVALPTQHKVQFYESRDLKNWTHLSDFGPAGATSGVWECPALFKVPVEGSDQRRWVLQVDLNPGSVAGGSGGQYFVGDFDGTTFTPRKGSLENAPHWVDYGPDFYATIPWNNVPDDGRALWLAWMNNWTYAEQIPTSPWRSAQTIPRSVGLRTIDGAPRLVQRPVEELQQLRTNHVHLDGRPLSPDTVSLAEEGVSGTMLELITTFEPGDADTVGLHVRAGENEKTVIGYDAGVDSIFVDRTDAGTDAFHKDFPARDSAPLALREGRVKLHVFVDRSSVEVFANDGARVLTHRIFPDSTSDGVSLVATGDSARLMRLDAWSLQSLWADW